VNTKVAIQNKRNSINPKNRVIEAPLLDNIAQLPTDSIDNLGKRARSKYYTQKIVTPLLYTESPLHKTYERTYHCASKIVQTGKTLKSKFCNGRLCHVCNRIRTAKMMAGYIEPLKQLGQLYFTTLTIKNVTAEELPKTIGKMLKDMSNIIRVLREKRKIDISGIRKIEITYNAKMNTYHPHFHLLHNTDSGNMIIDEWIVRNPNSAKKMGWDAKLKKMIPIQVSIPVTKENDNDKKYLNELFKYASKFVVKDDKERGILNVYVPALDNIMRSLHTKRTMQSFGKIRKIVINSVENLSENLELIAQEIEGILEENKEWKWEGQKDIYDWVDKKGNRLTNYTPPNIDFQYFIGDIAPYTKTEEKREERQKEAMKKKYEKRKSEWNQLKI
jgi:plasmid rolling circle replication initiator protein Rep